MNNEVLDILSMSTENAVGVCLEELSHVAKKRPSDEVKSLVNNMSKEEISRWTALIFSQWLIGKVEDASGKKARGDKNPEIKKYIKAVTPGIVAYVESMEN